MKKIKTFWSWLKKDKKRLVGGIIILILLIFGIYKIISKKSNQPQYQTEKAEKGTIISTVSASGTVLASGILNIKTQASGVVKKVYVKDGDKVYQGQKIAEITLDSTGLQTNAQNYASYLSAKASLESANTSVYTLQSSMFAANQKFINDAAARGLSTSDPTYIQEYADWKAAEAKYINQQISISQAKSSLTSSSLNYQQTSGIITAPFSGTISNLSLVEGIVIGNTSGTTTTFSQQVATIESQTAPVISISLTEIDVAKIKVGQKVTVTFDSLTDKTFTGVVAAVNRIGTVSSNVTSYLAYIKLDVKSPDILSNMAAQAKIIIATKDNVVLVPSAAVKTVSGEKTVQILKNGKVETVTVETGLSSTSQIEIVSGISEGDEVITSTTTSSAQNSGSQNATSPFGGFGGGAFRVTGGR